jgi:enoyl-CoA hydratase/carnithine racemase
MPKTAAPDTVLVARDKDIATVTLNRPEKLNAITLGMWARLGAAMRALDKDKSVRCIVIRGAGTQAFAPGADIGEFNETRSSTRKAVAYGKIMQPALEAILTCRHPTIAMIHGLCVGGGLEIAAMCDLRIAAESARLGLPINRIGVVAAYPELKVLVDLVGRATVLEILLEARVFGAAEAKEKGLLTRVVPDAKLEADVYAAARRIADGAPLSNQWHKKAALRVLDPKPITRAEYLQGFATCDSDDYLEGYRAFLEKRKAKFKGR